MPALPSPGKLSSFVAPPTPRLFRPPRVVPLPPAFPSSRAPRRLPPKSCAPRQVSFNSLPTIFRSCRRFIHEQLKSLPRAIQRLSWPADPLVGLVAARPSPAPHPPTLPVNPRHNRLLVYRPPEKKPHLESGLNQRDRATAGFGRGRSHGKPGKKIYWRGFDYTQPRKRNVFFCIITSSPGFLWGELRNRA